MESIQNTLRTFVCTGALLVLATASSAATLEPKLDVPGDFPNTFHMDLLSGTMYLDSVYGGSMGGFTFSPTGGLSQILFDAEEFDGVGVGYGTSQLTLSSINHWDIGSVHAFGYTGGFYIDGTGTGTLVDRGDGSGDWTLNIPLKAQWNGTLFDFTGFSLSTSASYTYSVYDPYGGATENTINGVAMDYFTGDAFLVGQAVVTDPNNPFYGIRITLGINGNDPVLSSVPVPAAAWLFGSGLIALLGVARRRKAA